MAWGAKTALAAASGSSFTAISTVQQFSDVIELNRNERAKIQIAYDNNDAAPASFLEVAIIPTLDDAVEVDFDTFAAEAFLIPVPPAGPNVTERYSFVVEREYKFRLGFTSSTAAQTYDVTDLFYRLDGGDP